MSRWMIAVVAMVAAAAVVDAQVAPRAVDQRAVDQRAVDQHASDPRAIYQRAIDRYYPGFRIIPIADLASSRDAKDGVRGTLVAGRFDFDSTPDFAAYIVPAKTPALGRGATAGGDAGKFVICLGATGGYRCEAQDRPFGRPVDSQLEVMPPGRYPCYAGTPAVTTIASVGESSEQGGGLYVRNRDGSIRLCMTAD